MKLSSCESYTSLSLTSEAWRAICAATSLWGRPAAEKMGIFCPRATEFITSMAEIPGYCWWRCAGWGEGKAMDEIGNLPDCPTNKA